MLTRKRALPGHRVREVELEHLLELLPLLLRDRRVHDPLDHRRGQLGEVLERRQVAVEPELGPRTAGQVQVGGAALEHDARAARAGRCRRSGADSSVARARVRALEGLGLGDARPRLGGAAGASARGGGADAAPAGGRDGRRGVRNGATGAGADAAGAARRRPPGRRRAGSDRSRDGSRATGAATAAATGGDRSGRDGAGAGGGHAVERGGGRATGRWPGRLVRAGGLGRESAAARAGHRRGAAAGPGSPAARARRRPRGGCQAGSSGETARSVSSSVRDRRRSRDEPTGVSGGFHSCPLRHGRARQRAGARADGPGLLQASAAERPPLETCRPARRAARVRRRRAGSRRWR